MTIYIHIYSLTEQLLTYYYWALETFLFLYASSCSCVCGGVNGCFHVHGYMCMWNCMCTMCEPVFGGLKFTCVFFDDSLLIEAGSLTLTEPRARAYQFNYSDEPACPSFRIQGLGITGNRQTCPAFTWILGNLHSVAHVCLTSTLLTEISPSPFYFFRYGC